MELKVARCSREAARFALKRWHFLGAQFSSLYHSYGAWEDGEFIGVLIYCMPSMPKREIFYEVKAGELVELAKVALGSHKSQTSRIVTIATRLFLKANPAVKIITTYSDPEEGHHGGIFQAAGWTYIGQGGRTWKAGGLHSRTLVGDLGLTAAEIKKLPGAHRSEGKHRYVWPVTKETRAWAERLRLPYPKRASVARTEEQPPSRGEVGGASPTQALHD